MLKRVVIDSGPCVALFDKDDQFHERAVKFAKQFSGQLVTSRAVVTEVMYVLDFEPRAQRDFLSWIDRGAVSLMEPRDFQGVVKLMTKYGDLPMDIADGMLVALCDELGEKHVATFDRDFEIYRFKARGRFLNVLA